LRFKKTSHPFIPFDLSCKLTDTCVFYWVNVICCEAQSTWCKNYHYWVYPQR